MAGGCRPNALSVSSTATAESVRTEASVTTRREAESAASSGTTTSQIAAKEVMPPVHQATAVTRAVSETDDMTCAFS